MRAKALSCWIGCCLVSMAHVQASERELKLSAMQVSGQALPFQPVRVRFILENTGSKPVPNISWEGSVRLDESNIRAITGVEELFDAEYETLVAIPLKVVQLADYVRLRLRPGEKESHSTTILPGLHHLGLSKPGNYTVSHHFSVPPDYHVRIASNAIQITVAEPKGDDAAVYKLLLANRHLVAAMATKTVPNQHWLRDVNASNQVTGELNRILENYPRSSYADFARFALARQYLKEAKVSQALAKGEPTLGSRSRSKEAKALLEAIDTVNFVYGPDVLMLLREASSDQAGRGKLVERLERYFADDLGWLRSDRNELLALLNVVRELINDKDEIGKIDALLGGIDAPDGETAAREYVSRHHKKRYHELREAKLIPIARGPRNWKPPADSK